MFNKSNFYYFYNNFKRDEITKLNYNLGTIIIIPRSFQIYSRKLQSSTVNSKKLQDSRVNNNIKFNTTKNFPPSSREWNNSFYSFNKNYLNAIPEAHKIAIKLIKSYFSLYNKNLENNLRKLIIKKRFKRLSSNKIYVSNGTFKHTNDKVTIILYVYNRQKINYVLLMKRKFKKFLNKRLTKTLLSLKYEKENYINEMEKQKLLIFELIKNENNEIAFGTYKSLFNKYIETNINDLIFKLLRKYKKYFLYKQLLYINQSKFNYNYLTYLNYLIKKIYNKNIQFNIINLKYFYLNSDIFTESILLKIKRDRRKIIRKLKYLFLKSKVNKISRFITYKPINVNKLNLNTKDPVNEIILNFSYKKKKSLKKTVLNLVKYKRVTGIRLEAKGRLTRRYTASRSVTKLRYKGNLINIDSSYLGLSSIYLKGNLRSNLQYTKLKSKTRIGSFGLKGWISGY